MAKSLHIGHSRTSSLDNFSDLREKRLSSDSRRSDERREATILTMETVSNNATSGLPEDQASLVVQEPSFRWKDDKWIVVSWAIVSVIIITAIYLAIYLASVNARKRTITSRCSGWALDLSSKFADASNQALLLSQSVNILQSQNATALNQAGFSSLAIGSTISAITYSPFVRNATRRSYEAANNLTCIRSWNGSCQLDLSYYAPIYLSQGFGLYGSEIIGVDILSETSIRLEANGAILPPVTLPLVNLTNVLLQLHVLSANSSLASPNASLALNGFILVFYNMQQLVDRVLQQVFVEESPADLSAAVQLYDTTNASSPVLLYNPPIGGAQWGYSDRYEGKAMVSLGDASRRLELHCRFLHPHPSFVPPFLSSVAAFALVTLLFMAALYAVIRHRGLASKCEHLEGLKEQMRVAKVAAEAASKAKGTFLATMSHEIRTPMNGVIGMMNLLLQTKLDATQLDYVETARTSGRALCSLINDILDLSKIEAGRMELEQTRVDLRAEVDDVLSMFGERTRKKPQVEVAAFVHDSVPDTIVGDALRFRQVLINLLSNSCKFTSRGHIFIMIRTASPDEKIDVDGAHFADGKSVSRLSEDRGSRSSQEVDNQGTYLRLKRLSWDTIRNSLYRNSIDSKADLSRRSSMSRNSMDARPEASRRSSMSRNSLDTRAEASRRSSMSRSSMDARAEGSRRPSTSRASVDFRLDGLPGMSPRAAVPSVKQDSAGPWGKWSDFQLVKEHGWMTLSGMEAEESCNSWHRICDLVDPPAGSQPSLVEDTGNVRLFISVEDTGQGIPWAAQDRLFKPFVQADISTTRTHGGTGIGLSISQHLVALMGGRLAFVSKPQVGTTFFFELNVPFVKDAVPEARMGSKSKGKASSAVRSADLQGRAAVVVDDRPVRAAVTSNFLQRLQMDVYRVASFKEIPSLMQQMKQRMEAGRQAAASEDSHDSDKPHFDGFQSNSTPPLPPIVLAETDTLTKNGDMEKNWRDCISLYFLAESGAMLGTPSSSTAPPLDDDSPFCMNGLPSWRAVLLAKDPDVEDRARQSGFDAMLLKPLRKANVAGCLAQALKPAKAAVEPTAPTESSKAALTPSPLTRRGSQNEKSSFVRGMSPLRASFIRERVSSEITEEANIVKPQISDAAIAGRRADSEEVAVQVEDMTTSQMLGMALVGKKFLVVDDNMVNRKVIQRMLQRYGVEVTAVVGGPQAVEKMKPDHSFDCVLMDVQMPGMDGFETTRRIREQEESNSMERTPVFALTADIFYGTRERATESGMDGFLSKPIEEDQLWTVIKKFFPLMNPKSKSS